MVENNGGSGEGGKFQRGAAIRESGADIGWEQGIMIGWRLDKMRGMGPQGNSSYVLSCVQKEYYYY